VASPDTFDIGMGTNTFELTDRGATVVDALSELGFEFGRPQDVTTTLLDTFDGRLHRSGLRLLANESGHIDLELTGDSMVPAHLTVDALPRFPVDLPPGPFRSRIADLTDVRALVPQLRVRATRTSGTWRDPSGKVVALAELYDGVRVVDRPAVDCPGATVEIHRVPGYDKAARLSRKTLRALGVTECDADTLTQCARAAGIDLAGFEAAATVPLDPEMATIDGFRRLLDNLASTITANWQGTIDQTDPEFLHDLRIAVRRSRTILSESKAVLPAAVLGPAREEFARLAALTGAPRDLDVYLLEWSRYTDPLGADVTPSLEPVRDVLERRCADVHLELETGLRSERASDLMEAWRTWLTEPLALDDRPPRADRPLGALVAKRIAHAHGVLIERGRMIGPDTPAEQVHDLRKDAKKLRYLVECFGSLLPDDARTPFVKRLKALQDNLGEHQDAEVHISMLESVANELHDTAASADTMVAIGRLTHQLDQQRLAARAEFAERFAAYDRRATQRALDAMLEGITS
jgi:CHAD domain-containing protein